MKRYMTLTVLGLLFIAGTAVAQDPVQNALNACEPEIETFCSQVSPGDGRLLACFYAHEDKLSGRCSWALYEASEQLEQFVAAIGHLATNCQDDLMKHCGDVEIGEGRVGECLLEHEDEVSAACQQAIEDTGLEMVED